MTDFKAIKPDVRILLLQVLLSVVLLSSFHTVYALWALFSVLALATLFFCGWRSFFKNILLFAVLNGLFYGLTALKITVLSGIFPPFLTLLIRVAPAWLTLTILNARSRMDEMLYALDRMHIPKTLSIPLMVVYRYVPTIFQELRCIHESLKMRGLNSWHHPWRTLDNHVVPLLARSEKISEELSAASLCKGLSAERRRTSCTEVRIDRFDLLYLIGMLLAAVALIFFDRFAKGGFSL